jgi:hypothetical protein
MIHRALERLVTRVSLLEEWRRWSFSGGDGINLFGVTRLF